MCLKMLVIGYVASSPEYFHLLKNPIIGENCEFPIHETLCFIFLINCNLCSRYMLITQMDSLGFFHSHSKDFRHNYFVIANRSSHFCRDVCNFCNYFVLLIVKANPGDPIEHIIWLSNGLNNEVMLELQFMSSGGS